MGEERVQYVVDAGLESEEELAQDCELGRDARMEAVGGGGEVFDRKGEEAELVEVWFDPVAQRSVEAATSVPNRSGAERDGRRRCEGGLLHGGERAEAG